MQEHSRSDFVRRVWSCVVLRKARERPTHKFGDGWSELEAELDRLALMPPHKALAAVRGPEQRLWKVRIHSPDKDFLLVVESNKS